MLHRLGVPGLLAVLALLALPVEGRAWKVDVFIHGAGVVDEITPRDLTNCTVGLDGPNGWTRNGTETTCTGGTPSGLYAQGDVIELIGRVPDELSRWGWRLERWVDGTASEQINCDPQDTTGNQWASIYGDDCKFQIFGNRWVHVYFVDTTGPVTTLNPSGPGNDSVTTSREAAYSFGADDPRSTFKCSLSGPNWQNTPLPCSPGHSYSALADGVYTFTVQSFDPSSNGGNAPTRSWRVDTTPPTINIGGGPTANQQTESAMATFSVSTSDATVTTVQCTLDGQQRNCGDSYTNLTDGTHTFSVTAKDVVNNTSTAVRTWIVDRFAPETTITGGPAASLRTSLRPPFTFTSSEAGTFSCSIDGGPFATCSSPHLLPGLADGAHTFQVRATDPYGHTDSSPATRVWTLDTTPPDTEITDGPADRSVVSSNSVVFAFTSAESGAVFECRVDGGEFSVCSSPYGATLVAGDHVFEVRGRDAAGNVDATPARRSWRVSADYAVVSAGIIYQWAFKGTKTWPKLLKVTKVQKGSTVKVTCKNKKRGCPFKTKKLKGTGKDLNIKKFFKSRKLKRGATLKIEVTAPGMTMKVVSFKMRKGKLPSGGKYRCRRPGEKATIACPPT